MNWQDLPDLSDDRPILIAGATATGKSALALEIAEKLGGVIVNADASQVYRCWRVVTARPTPEEEARAPHALYGHVPCDADYSTGHWLREVAPLLDGPRPIITGGTGLYFSALTEGLADIPATPPDIRAEADTLPLETLLAGIAADTAAGLDRANRARVQRAWEVERATGTALHIWQTRTGPPLLPLETCTPILLNAEKGWLEARIRQRFDRMLEQGALDEVAAQRARYDPARPAFHAIGVPELVALLDGVATLDETRESVAISTRRFAKRQRTWFRKRMSGWHQLDWPAQGE